MLGLPYDYAIDMWSAGCVIYEMFTGKILFPGKSNNEMLRMHMEVKGMFPRKMLRRSKFWSSHFYDNFDFMAETVDEVTKQVYVKSVHVSGPTRQLKNDLLSVVHDGESTAVEQLADFLEQCFELNPLKRATPENALRHAFFRQC